MKIRQWERSGYFKWINFNLRGVRMFQTHLLAFYFESVKMEHLKKKRTDP